MDHATTDMTVQYNYTHSNAWGFFEFCCNGSDGSVDPVVRYNISQDDGSARAVFRLFGVNTSGTAQIYNNTVYVDSATNSPITVNCVRPDRKPRAGLKLAPRICCAARA